jgi:hypothetical protein
MGGDDREEAARCVTVPYELVHELVCSTLATLEEWHRENEFDIDLEVCSAAVLVMSKSITAQFLGLDPEGGTLQ